MFKKRLIFTTLLLLPFLSLFVFAQETNIEQRVKDLEEHNKKIKISGYVQGQFLNAEDKGIKTFSGTNFPAESQNVFMVKRGRLKTEYKSGLLNGVFQLDANENGIFIKDAYLDVKEPWLEMLSIRGGLFKVPMSYELLNSSTSRFSPERARITQTLIPGERDLGAMITFQAPKKHLLAPISLNIALFSGNSISPENDNQKNLVARLYYDNTFGNFQLGLGASTYQGGVFQNNDTLFKMDGTRFVADVNANNKGQQATRSYFVGELFLGYKSSIGTTILTGEFWTGQQPGTASSSTSPKSTTFAVGPTYLRDFQGIIASIAHEIIGTNLTVSAKYDTYNPNTKVTKNDIGVANSSTSATDLSYTTIGAGLIYEPVKNLRFTLWYDIVSNEKTETIKKYSEDVKDNVLTFRIQVKF